ncbi:MAG: 4Fe-4S dicluster domain-containing protein [Desulfobacteraceae bacterium]|nr:MAG: 4Fe-4S dicluster domain-containing protein [Desulfobacteraceae bacterium]
MHHNDNDEGMDAWLKERYDKYTGWFDRGEIDYSSKVIPVRESFRKEQWVLPTAQVINVLKSSELIALTDCVCRSHYKRCDNPLDVCLLLDGFGQKFIEKGLAKQVRYGEAVSILKAANESGLVHLSLYRPDRNLFALCSCCACCCHDLQLLIKFGKERLVCHSDYVSATDTDLCSHCGECVDRCVFGARSYSNGEMTYDPDRCFGCGLCVTSCPAKATTMEPR